MGTVFINRSSKTFQVTATNGGSDVIGEIKPDDVFCWTGSWEGNHTRVDYQAVYARGTNKILQHGWTSGMTGTKAFTPLTDLALAKRIINGKTFYGFLYTRDVQVFPSSGDNIGLPIASFEAPVYVYMSSSTCGSKRPARIHIDYLDQDCSGILRPYEGFVEIGLRFGANMWDISLMGDYL